jgi:hypothetical protein
MRHAEEVLNCVPEENRLNDLESLAECAHDALARRVVPEAASLDQHVLSRAVAESNGQPRTFREHSVAGLYWEFRIRNPINHIS